MWCLHLSRMRFIRVGMSCLRRVGSAVAFIHCRTTSGSVVIRRNGKLRRTEVTNLSPCESRRSRLLQAAQLDRPLWAMMRLASSPIERPFTEQSRRLNVRATVWVNDSSWPTAACGRWRHKAALYRTHSSSMARFPRTLGTAAPGQQATFADKGDWTFRRLLRPRSGHLIRWGGGHFIDQFRTMN